MPNAITCVLNKAIHFTMILLCAYLFFHYNNYQQEVISEWTHSHDIHGYQTRFRIGHAAPRWGAALFLFISGTRQIHSVQCLTVYSYHKGSIDSLSSHPICYQLIHYDGLAMACLVSYLFSGAQHLSKGGKPKQITSKLSQTDSYPKLLQWFTPSLRARKLGLTWAIFRDHRMEDSDLHSGELGNMSLGWFCNHIISNSKGSLSWSYFTSWAG